MTMDVLGSEGKFMYGCEKNTYICDGLGYVNSSINMNSYGGYNNSYNNSYNNHKIVIPH